MSDSTLNSTIDYVKGGVQSGVAYVTGSSGDASKAQETKDKAEFENEASHTVGKLGPVNMTPSGGVSTDSPDRTQGQWDQTVGSAKQAIGGLVGSEGLKSQGEQQNADGKAQEAKGELSDLAGGTADRFTGTLGAIGSAITGDKESHAAYQERREDGRSIVRGVEQTEQERAAAGGK